MQEVDEYLAEGRQKLARVGPAVELEERVHQTVGGGAELIFVQDT
jgi:hypothetical protein